MLRALVVVIRCVCTLMCCFLLHLSCLLPWSCLFMQMMMSDIHLKENETPPQREKEICPLGDDSKREKIQIPDEKPPLYPWAGCADASKAGMA